jgi:ABC-type lipoprotein release transport system permease subunit
MARIPLWSLLILSTGFISLLTANVRANAGELRTLHAIGMTRAQMGRFLFAQALMISFTATILSLILGASIGWGFTGWTLANMPFGGLPSVFILPMGRVLEGLGILLLSIFILTPLPISCLLKRLLK